MHYKRVILLIAENYLPVLVVQLITTVNALFHCTCLGSLFSYLAPLLCKQFNSITHPKILLIFDFMRNARLITGTICFIMADLLFFQQASAQKQAGIKAVAAVVETLRKAMIDADSAKLSQLTSSQLTFGHSTGRLEDKATFIHAFTSGASDFTSLEFADQTIQVSGTTAIVRHTLNGATNDKGKAPGTVKLLVILVWQKVKGQWLLLARQAIKPPVS